MMTVVVTCYVGRCHSSSINDIVEGAGVLLSAYWTLAVFFSFFLSFFLFSVRENR